MTELGGPPAWEYTYLEGSTGRLTELIGVLNDMATDGWELVSVQSADTPAGVNWTTLFLRRQIVPLPRPHSLEEGWYPDPAGRFAGRFWNGEAWTFHVFTGSAEHRDPPTKRVPVDLLQQKRP